MKSFKFSAAFEASPLERYTACKAMARGYAEGKKTDKTRLAHARAFCAAVLEAYWTVQCKATARP